MHSMMSYLLNHPVFRQVRQQQHPVFEPPNQLGLNVQQGRACTGRRGKKTGEIRVEGNKRPASHVTAAKWCLQLLQAEWLRVGGMQAHRQAFVNRSGFK